MQQQSPIRTQKISPIAPLTTNAILIGPLSSREHSRLTSVRRGQICTVNGCNGDLEPFRHPFLTMVFNPIIHTYSTRYLKRLIVNAQIKHRLQVTTLVLFGLDSDLTLASSLDIQLLIINPFTVHTFAISRSLRLGTCQAFCLLRSPFESQGPCSDQS